MAKSSPAYQQKCAYCGVKFVPAKRGTQRFCQASCRVGYCRKKKAGTLGKLHYLPGPPRSGAGLSFAQTALAAGLGAVGANTVTQSAEYLLVTQDLRQQVQALQQALAAWGPPPGGAAALAQPVARPAPTPTLAEQGEPIEFQLRRPSPQEEAALARAQAVLDQPFLWPEPTLAEPPPPELGISAII